VGTNAVGGRLSACLLSSLVQAEEVPVVLDVSGPVGTILSGYGQLLGRYRTQVTGDPASLLRSADGQRGRAGTVRSVADAITRRSTALAATWEAPEQVEFATAAAGLATRLAGTEGTLRRAADRLTGAAAALTTARTSVDAEITRFTATAKMLLAAARSVPENQVQALYDNAKRAGAGAARTAQRIAHDLGRALASLDQCLAPEAQQPFGPGRPLKVSVIGNSYGAGEGVGEGTKQGTAKYYDATDRRHRSPFAAAIQALERLQRENPTVPVEAHFAASSGAVTRDVVTDQTYEVTMRGGEHRQKLVNEAQLFQIPKDANVVVADFGGNDALFGPVITAAHNPFRDAPAEFVKQLDEAGKLLSDKDADGRPYTVEDYRAQAAGHEVGQAPTVVARWLQVIDEIRARAPEAVIVIPNYPDGVDPKALDAGSNLLSSSQGRAIENRLVEPLNAALRTVTEIAGPGVTLADVSTTLRGHEVYTNDPWINGLEPYNSGRDGRYSTTWTNNEPFHPNDRGYGAMANPIGKAIADQLGLAPPAVPPDGTVTWPDHITVIQASPDFDGDGVPNAEDPTPGVPRYQGRVTR
jgi:lysophospholipase L1-like esterase